MQRTEVHVRVFPTNLAAIKEIKINRKCPAGERGRTTEITQN